MKFNRSYFLCFLVLISIEACIAIFVKDGFIRHTLGDYLVVILLYCLIKSFFNLKPLTAAWIVLIVATSIELGQYFDLLSKLDLEQNYIANLILGNTFHLNDLVAYFIGILSVLFIEINFSKRSN